MHLSMIPKVGLIVSILGPVGQRGETFQFFLPSLFFGFRSIQKPNSCYPELQQLGDAGVAAWLLDHRFKRQMPLTRFVLLT